VLIKNSDDLCLARAIAVAKARLEHIAAPDNNRLRNLYKDLCKGDKPPRKQQFNAAKTLMKAAGLENHKGACGIPQIQAIQDILPDYQIRIFNTQSTAALVYSGPPADNIIYLYNHENHYDVITKPPGFFDRGYYCKDCNVTYGNKEMHQCDTRCPCCHETPACPDVQYKDTIKCPNCNRYFRGQTCLLNHTKHTERKMKDKTVALPSICDRLQCCKDCGKHLRGTKAIREHKCHNFMCRTCQKMVPIKDHLCYMQPLDPKKEVVDYIEEEEDEEEEGEDVEFSEDEEKEEREKPLTKFVFYDFETRQEQLYSTNEYGEILAHEPNLCVVHTVCELCMDQPLGTCKNCGQNRHVFSGDNTADQFCDYLFGLKHVTAFAHNAQGFDGHFIMQYLQKQDIAPKIITRGMKIMSLQVGTVRLIDSYNFLPMVLSAMPKAFDEPELKKGHFPHLFNTKDNQNYTGPWPDAIFYSPATMMPKARDTFYQWYNRQKGKIFDFQKEFLAYCESDVDILRRCCLKFRDLFM